MEEVQGNSTVTVQQMPSKNSKKMLTLGIVSLSNAVILIGLGGFLVSKTRGDINKHGMAIWASIIFGTYGLLGIFSFCSQKNRAVVTAHNVFTVMSIVLATILVAASAYGIFLFRDCDWQQHVYKQTYYTYYYNHYNYRYNRYNYRYNYRYNSNNGYGYSYSPTPTRGPRSVVYTSRYSDWNHYICSWGGNRKYALIFHCLVLSFSVIQLVVSILSTRYGFKIFNCCKFGCPKEDCCPGGTSNTAQTNHAQHLQQYQLQPLVGAYFQAGPGNAPAPVQFVSGTNNQSIPSMPPLQAVVSSAGQQYYLVPTTQGVPASIVPQYTGQPPAYTIASSLSGTPGQAQPMVQTASAVINMHTPCEGEQVTHAQDDTAVKETEQNIDAAKESVTEMHTQIGSANHEQSDNSSLDEFDDASPLIS